jgi:uncharacterized sodium:solute symporter family permease YidK
VHVAVHEVLNADAIATAKCFTIGRTVPAGDVGMAILIAVIYIGAPVVSIVLAGAFNAVAVAATLNILAVL